MHNIITIFKSDIRHLTGSFWAMVVIVFCMLLPAMYAWVNIYANWDPYGNTGGVKIAVVSNDKDYTTEDGEVVNVGDQVIKNLRESTAIGWQFMDDTEKALDGVYDGSYYAAIIIDENFTYNMYNFLTTDMTSPTIRYYVNSKTNAIAVKITDTAASTLKSTVSESYLKVIIETIFEKINGVYGDFEAADPVAGLEDVLNSVNNNIANYRATLAAFTNAGNMLQSDLANMNETIDYAIYTIGNSRQNISQQVQDVESAQGELALWNEEINNSLTNISDLLEKAIAQLSGRDIATTTTPTATIEELEKQYDELIAYLETRGGENDPATADVLSALNKNRAQLEELRKSLGLTHQFTTDDQAYLNSVESTQMLTSVQSDFNDTVVPALYNMYVDPQAASVTDSNRLTVQSLQDMSQFMLSDVSAKLDSVQENAALAASSTDPAVGEAALAKAKEDSAGALSEMQSLNMTYSMLSQQVTGFDDAGLLAATQTAATQLAAVTSPLASGNLVSIKAMLEGLQVGVDNVRETMTGAVYPALNGALDNLKSTLGDLSSVLLNLSDVLQNSKPLIAAMGNAANSLNDAFASTQSILTSISDSITDVLKKLDDMQNDERIQTLLDFFGLDPDAIGEFLAQPVDTVTETVYPVENYGSGMTPFYSALAIWVGSVVLCAVIKTKASTAGLVNPTMTQLFFGRYLTFFVFAELQAVIILLGDMFLLGCQCLHPWLFLLSGLITGLSFSMLIFSLTISFGDVGKAIVVVIMILQIAGSSGSFPIELLPEFFQKMYIFFPFPYAINAMRECIAGMYQMDYWKYLAELMVFAAAGLFVALVIRKPFVGLTEYLEEKTKGTEMM